MRYAHNHVFFAILICLIVLLTGCGSSTKTETPPPVSQFAPAVATQTAVQPAQSQPASVTKLTESRNEGTPSLLASVPSPVEPPEVVMVCEGQVEPPDPYIVKDHPVPYGGKVWPKWRITGDVVLYQDKDPKSLVVSRLVPGDVVQVVGSEIRAHPAKLLVTKDYTSPEGRRFLKGDTLYVLYRYEEEVYRIWHNGVVFYSGLEGVKGTAYYRPEYSEWKWGELLDNGDKRTEWWVELLSLEGQRGWTNLNKRNITWVK
jgi:hypothetical protein